MQSTWWNRRAIGLHITAIVLIPTFLVLGWWQLQRALHGNSLSWAYTFEWPIFAAYGTYMWWKIVHDIADEIQLKHLESTSDADVSAPASVGAAPANDVPMNDEERQLAGYNAYLDQLRRETETNGR